MQKECVAMILAGGQGSRLGLLTKKLAKPAVPFGGKYRIIDFTLSNCHNSGIDTVGVLTQYQPLALHSYIGIGSAWDLDRKNSGVFVLPPFVREQGGEWYKGTADAIYQNMSFIDLFEPEYVLVLSGDHIYKMDYSLMLDYHKQQQAEVTIAVIEVPWEEAGRFGVMNTDEHGRIVAFEEKPKVPKSNLASMGVYIFDWGLLKQALLQDASDELSSHDFGKNVIPKLLQRGKRLFAYAFDGYWKDVGTVESFWEANMDLLRDEPELDLYDPGWRIYSVNHSQPPHYLAATAEVKRSLISNGCMVYGKVENSVLFPGVYIAADAYVKDSIIMPQVKVGRGVHIIRAIVGQKSVIENDCRIGCTLEEGSELTVVGENQHLAGGSVFSSNCEIE